MKKYFLSLITLLVGMSTSVSAQHFGTYHHTPHHDVRYVHHYDTYHTVHHYDRHSDASVAGVLVGALIGGAIVAAAESANNSQPAQPVQPVTRNRATNTYTANLNNSIRYGNSNANVVSNQLQHYVSNGVSYDSNEPYARITKVETTPNKTIVHFEYLRMDRDSRLGINQDVYLKDRVTNKKIHAIACNGVSMDNWTNIQGGDTHQFSITFPAVDANCHSIDIVEPNDGGKKYYHVVF